jgi:RNA polymerase sigma-70 factor (ECF subfamily)
VDDDTVIRTLYDRYRRPLFGYVLRSVGGDHQYAEDIVQETMTRAWAHSTELDPDRAGGWLFTVARNLVISGQRKRAARVTEVAIDGREFAALGDDIDRVLQAWQVAEVLRGLSDEHRQVIIELFYRRRTVAEAAAVLSFSSPTCPGCCTPYPSKTSSSHRGAVLRD